MNDAVQNNQTSQPIACLKCGNPEVVRDVPNPLCDQCRTAAIKFPIPLWVKLFGGGILLLIIFSLINLPQNLLIGIKLERGIRAEEQHKYVTAFGYFAQAVKMDSGNTEANAHLLIAAYYNNDMTSFLQAGSKLADKNIDDDALLGTVNGLANKTNYYFASDSFYTALERYTSADAIPDSVYINYIKQNDDNVYEETLYASKLFTGKNYRGCDSLVHIILNTDDENFSALGIMASAKRFENQPDSAIYYCDRMLTMNNEFVYARCLKARALLKMKRNSEALQLALDCKQQDSTDAYTLATLALVYHFTNEPTKRDAVLHKAENALDSNSAPVFQYVHDVINNKETL